jgi:hypothetical protein
LRRTIRRLLERRSGEPAQVRGSPCGINYRWVHQDTDTAESTRRPRPGMSFQEPFGLRMRLTIRCVCFL